MDLLSIKETVVEYETIDCKKTMLKPDNDKPCVRTLVFYYESVHFAAGMKSFLILLIVSQSSLPNILVVMRVPFCR